MPGGGGGGGGGRGQRLAVPCGTYLPGESRTMAVQDEPGGGQEQDLRGIEEG